MLKNNKLMAAMLFLLSSLSVVVNATIVRFETSLGDIDVNLYDLSTPLTVTNFLAYVNADDYDGSMIHRSSAGFIIQGGGFRYEGLNSNDVPVIGQVTTMPPVTNEPVFSNVRGTIAMAKVGGDPDSATSQWFFNLANNAANLDNQNGGFTVFGEVISGMDIVDQIAGLQRFDLSGGFGSSAFASMPLRNYTSADLTAGTAPDENNFVAITNIVVLDTTMDTAAGLNPPLTTRSESSEGGSGGGAFSFYSASLLALLLSFGLLTRRIFRRG